MTMPFDAASTPLSLPRWHSLQGDETGSRLSLTLEGRPLIQVRLVPADPVQVHLETVCPDRGVQGLLGPESVVTPVLTGGRNADDQIRLVPWGDERDPHRPTTPRTDPFPGVTTHPVLATQPAWREGGQPAWRDGVLDRPGRGRARSRGGHRLLRRGERTGFDHPAADRSHRPRLAV